MSKDSSDWRPQGQEKYLKDETLHFIRHSDRKTKTDHDHCEFCSANFSGNDNDDYNTGYATLDDYRWICESCFNDFKEILNLKLSDSRTA